MGRPSKMTAAVRLRLTEAVEDGVPIREACRLAGIGERTYYDWMKRAEDPLQPQEFAQFAADIAEARACAQEKLIKTIQVASAEPKHWRAAAWLLERGYPANWAETLSVRLEAEKARGFAEILAAFKAGMSPSAWAEAEDIARSMDSSTGPRGEQRPEALH